MSQAISNALKMINHQMQSRNKANRKNSSPTEFFGPFVSHFSSKKLDFFGQRVKSLLIFGWSVLSFFWGGQNRAKPAGWGEHYAEGFIFFLFL